MRFSQLSDWLSWMETLHPTPMELGLERVRHVAAELGLLTSFPPTILVGGTNGKGSTVSFLEATLTAAGYRVGTFTSPHLFDFTERIRVAGSNLEEVEIANRLAKVDAARRSTSLTYFEFATLAAMLAYRDHDVDFAVLEVGLGGRLDAVNITDPVASLITNIGLDHQRWLGTTREAIASEKVGIVRAGRPLIIGDKGAAGGVRQLAERRGGRVWQRGREYRVDHQGDGIWTLATPAALLAGLPVPAMGGPFQLANAAGALALLLAVGVSLPRSAVTEGLANARQPGRFQRVDLGRVEWVFDVAHNELGGRTLAAALRHQPAAGRTLACVAAMADKDFRGMVAPLVALIDGWYTAGVATARAAEPAELAEQLTQLGAVEVSALSSVPEAVDSAAVRAEPGDRVIVFGSFHTVAPALTHLRLARNHGYNPRPAKP